VEVCDKKRPSVIRRDKLGNYKSSAPKSIPHIFQARDLGDLRYVVQSDRQAYKKEGREEDS
jgi:hypothetical protein